MQMWSGKIWSRCERMDECYADAESPMSSWSCNTKRKIVRVRRLRRKLIFEISRRIRSAREYMEIRCTNECEEKSSCFGCEYGKALGDWRIWRRIEFINRGSLRSGIRHMDSRRTDVCSWRRRWCRSHSNNLNFYSFSNMHLNGVTCSLGGI